MNTEGTNALPACCLEISGVEGARTLDTNQDWSLRTRTNEETDLLIKHANIITYVKTPRMRWIGQILRTYKERTVKIITERKPTVVRKFGRPKLRWEDHVRADLGKMKTQSWSKMAMDKEAWKITAQQRQEEEEDEEEQEKTHEGNATLANKKLIQVAV